MRRRVFVDTGAWWALADPEAAARLSILAHGPGWLAVDKPAGMPVRPHAEDERGTVLNAIAALEPAVHGVGEGGLRSGVVHRLDVETSGVLLVATREDAWRRLRRAFAERRVEKVYFALVWGELASRPGEALEEVEVGLVVARHRPARVRVRYIDRENEIREMACEGLLATCVQHEIDHLDGVLFIDRISALKRGMILRKLVKARKEKERDGEDKKVPARKPDPDHVEM